MFDFSRGQGPQVGLWLRSRAKPQGVRGNAPRFFWRFYEHFWRFYEQKLTQHMHSHTTLEAVARRTASSRRRRRSVTQTRDNTERLRVRHLSHCHHPTQHMRARQCVRPWGMQWRRRSATLPWCLGGRSHAMGGGMQCCAGDEGLVGATARTRPTSVDAVVIIVLVRLNHAYHQPAHLQI